MKLYLPSLPYSDSWETTDALEGLVQTDGNFYNPTHIVHKNDTLYVTLKSNQVARDQFFELANMMEMMTDNNKDFPQNAQNRALKLLNDLLKNYIPCSQQYELALVHNESIILTNHQLQTLSLYSGYEINLNSPPPEVIFFSWLSEPWS